MEHFGLCIWSECQTYFFCTILDMGYLVFTKRQTFLWGGFGCSMLGNMEDQKRRVFRGEKNQSTYGDLMFHFFSVILLGRATEGRSSYTTGAGGRTSEGGGCTFPSEGGDASRRQQAGGHMTWCHFGQKRALVLEVSACVPQLPY
jgi:hypothetical protein